MVQLGLDPIDSNPLSLSLSSRVATTRLKKMMVMWTVMKTATGSRRRRGDSDEGDKVVASVVYSEHGDNEGDMRRIRRQQRWRGEDLMSAMRIWRR